MNANSHGHDDLNITKTGSYLGIFTAMYTIVYPAGSHMAGPASDQYGRRIGMVVGSFVVVIEAIAMSTAQTSVFTWQGDSSPALASRLSGQPLLLLSRKLLRSSGRGPATLLYNSLWLILSSCIAYSTGPLKFSLSWRIQLIIQVFPSLIVAVFNLFLPESPPGLVANDATKKLKSCW